MLAQEGTYYGVCKSIESDKTGTGTPLLKATFDLTQIAVDGQWSPIAAIEGILRIYLSDAAWSMSVKKLESLNFNGDFDHPAITIEGVCLICNLETYKGKTREKWELADFVGSGKCNPPDKATLLKLGARYKTATATSKTPASSPPPVPSTDPGSDPLAEYEGTPPSEAEVPAEDDIPF